MNNEKYLDILNMYLALQEEAEISSNVQEIRSLDKDKAYKVVLENKRILVSYVSKNIKEAINKAAKISLETLLRHSSPKPKENYDIVVELESKILDFCDEKRLPRPEYIPTEVIFDSLMIQFKTIFKIGCMVHSAQANTIALSQILVLIKTLFSLSQLDKKIKIEISNINTPFINTNRKSISHKKHRICKYCSKRDIKYNIISHRNWNTIQNLEIKKKSKCVNCNKTLQ